MTTDYLEGESVFCIGLNQFSDPIVAKARIVRIFKQVDQHGCDCIITDDTNSVFMPTHSKMLYKVQQDAIDFINRTMKEGDDEKSST